MTTRHPHEPQPARKYILRRRMVLAALGVIAIFIAAGMGAVTHKIFGWSTEAWAAYSTIKEPRELLAVNTSAATVKPTAQPPELYEPKHHNPIPEDLIRNANVEVRIESQGLSRLYLARVPSNAKLRTATETAETPLPLILMYHGYQETAESLSRYSGMDDDGAIVIYPMGIGRAWAGAPYAQTTGEQDLGFTQDIIDQIASTYQVDTHRIFAAGMSNGGGFAFKLACEMPETFNAVASVAGAYYPGTWQGCASEAQREQGTAPAVFEPGPSVAFLEIHSKDDSVINYSGGTRHGSPYLGAMQASRLYASRSGCQAAPTTVRVSATMSRTQWNSCRPDREVVHLAVTDAGHRWPGEQEQLSGSAALEGESENVATSSVTASSEILAFFERQSQQINSPS